MARKLRVQYPGAIYHVMNRWDRREAIFNGDGDRLLLLSTLGEACQKTDWQVHAWRLLLLMVIHHRPRSRLISQTSPTKLKT
jgi:putative transposase